MAAWIPVLKTVLPPLANIITSTVPAFTARKEGAVAQQISELQAAVQQNSSSVIELADKLKTTVVAVEAGASAAERSLRRLRWISFAALLLAVVSIALSLGLWLSQGAAGH